MNITLIGTGNMGRAIGHRLVTGGHSVTLVGKDPQSAQKLAYELSKAVKGDAVVQTATLENVSLGEVVVLAVKYGVNLDLARQLGPRLDGKVVVDIANPLNSTYDGLAIAADTSSAEELAKVAPASTKVVKAFNTTFAGTLVAGNVDGIPLDVFIAGDDETAKQKIVKLVEDGGLMAVDVGALPHSRQLESLALLGITLQIKHNLGFSTGWKLTRPH
jgi:8-hydroxy-5-deazaflavin:NADPH oxidoreductase